MVHKLVHNPATVMGDLAFHDIHDRETIRDWQSTERISGNSGHVYADGPSLPVFPLRFHKSWGVFGTIYVKYGNNENMMRISSTSRAPMVTRAVCRFAPLSHE